MLMYVSYWSSRRFKHAANWRIYMRSRIQTGLISSATHENTTNSASAKDVNIRKPCSRGQATRDVPQCIPTASATKTSNSNAPTGTDLWFPTGTVFLFTTVIRPTVTGSGGHATSHAVNARLFSCGVNRWEKETENSPPPCGVTNASNFTCKAAHLFMARCQSTRLTLHLRAAGRAECDELQFSTHGTQFPVLTRTVSSMTLTQLYWLYNVPSTDTCEWTKEDMGAGTGLPLL